MSKNLILSLALSIFTFAAGSAQAEDHLRENVARTSTSSNETASFNLHKDIYVTNWYVQNVCRDEPFYTDETYYENEWVANNQYVCDTQPDGSQNCNWVDQGSYQQVAHTRQITNWQNVCRDEQYPVDEFDHTWSVPVQVIFPAETVLLEGEFETISFELGGTEAKPKVTIDQSKSAFHYAIQSSTLTSGTLVVVLISKPYLSAKDVGVKNIGNAFLEFGDQSTLVHIEDKFSHLRVASSYRLAIADKKTKAVLGETTELTRDGNYLKAEFPVVLDSSKDYVLTLAVRRAGIMLSPATIDFQTTKTVRAEALDMSRLKSSAELSHFRVTGLQEKIVLGFSDGTPDYVTATSNYKIEVLVVHGKEKVSLGSAEFNRKALKKNKDGLFQISFQGDLKIDAANLAFLVKKTQLEIQVTATRVSKRFPVIIVNKSSSLQVSK